MSLSPSSSIVNRTIDLKYANKKRSNSLKWLVVNVVLLTLFVYDLSHKCAGYTTALHWVELCCAAVLGANVLQHAVRVVRCRRAPLALSPRQQRLLGRRARPAPCAGARVLHARRARAAVAGAHVARGGLVAAAVSSVTRVALVAARGATARRRRVHSRQSFAGQLPEAVRGARARGGLGRRRGAVVAADAGRAAPAPLPARLARLRDLRSGGGRGRGGGGGGAGRLAPPAAGAGARHRVEPEPASVAALHHPAAPGAGDGARGRGAERAGAGRGAPGPRGRGAPPEAPGGGRAALAGRPAAVPGAFRRPALRRAAHPRARARRLPQRLSLERRRLRLGREQARGRRAAAAAAGRLPGRAAAAGAGRAALQLGAPVRGAGRTSARAARARHPPRRRASAALRAGARRRDRGGGARPQQPAAHDPAVHRGGGAQRAPHAAAPAPRPRRPQHALDHRPVIPSPAHLLAIRTFSSVFKINKLYFKCNLFNVFTRRLGCYVAYYTERGPMS